MRAVQEHTSMTVKDFKFVNGEYVEFLESLTKTRKGGLHHKQRPTNPKMFAIGGPRCPYYLYSIYLSKQPIEMRTSGRLYLTPKQGQTFSKIQDEWFTRNSTGKTPSQES